jgi:hypothetical protein
MPTQAPKPQLEQDKEARLFIETLEKTGQLVDVDEQQDTSQLPARAAEYKQSGTRDQDAYRRLVRP